MGRERMEEGRGRGKLGSQEGQRAGREARGVSGEESWGDRGRWEGGLGGLRGAGGWKESLGQRRVEAARGQAA